MSKFLIVNADDFGASDGVNQGILDCHLSGIVTSASLMVTGRAAQAAVAISREHPALAIGLHWDVTGEDEREFNLDDLAAVRDEFQRQLARFHDLLGRMPTHLDSHRHVHRNEHLIPLFQELAEPLAVPLRGDGRVRFIGGFYAQWELGVTQLEHVSVEALEHLLADEVGEGWTELSCHPGYVSSDYASPYLIEREAEVRTLVAPHIRQTIDALGIKLVSYSDYAVRGDSSA